ncbi:TonB-dependent receptor [Burkholderia pyrrocinia]|uniref:TonB-dependent siderophore receptor n=1 Tax=Burkholderia pyrrocinia TaxID=60550 RepID=UPI002D061430|nr:TonB-dependent receptor [Burkholderia cepacia]HKT63745.1 TonB-dependent receptor [Burkholderia sp.]
MKLSNWEWIGGAVRTALAGAWWCAAAAAQGGEGAIGFHVPGGPLDTVLLEIARQAHLVLSFDDTLTAGLQADPLEGPMTVRDAFAKALVGTSLELAGTTDGTWTLRRSDVPSAPSRAPPPEIRETTTLLPPIRVRAQTDDDGFAVARSSATARLDLPLTETPQSVGVVNQAVLANQQAESVADAIGNVSGATPVYDAGNANYGIGIRGYTAQAPLVDGIVVESADYPPLAGVERVEVVKGPATALVGGSPNGGIVNLVTKRPRFDRHATVQTTLSSASRRESTVDLSGASNDGRLGYRIVVNGAQNGRSYGGYDGQRSFLVAPSVRYRDAETDVTVRVEQYRQRLPALPYTVGGDEGKPLPHTSLMAAGALDDHVSSDSLRVALNAERALGDGWKARMRATWLKYRTVTHWYVPAALLDSAGDVMLDGLHTDRIWHESVGAAELLRTFNVGGVSGTMLAGVEHWRMSSTYDVGQDMFVGQNLHSPRLLPSIATGPLTRVSDFTMRQLSGYAQLEMLFADRVRVLASLRHTNALLDKSLGAPLQRNSVWSPNVAASYMVTPSVTVYANWMHGFRPSLGTITFDGARLAENRTEQIEAGIKLGLLDGSLVATAAVYRLRDGGRIIGDPAHPGFYARVPGQRGRGVEFDLTGRMLPGLNVIASLTVSGSDTAVDTSGALMHAPAAPARAGSLWMTYALQAPAWRGWGIGGGVFARSQRATGAPGYTVPGDARVDATVFYQAPKWAVQLGVKNMFDRRIYGTGVYPNFIPVLPGRTFVLTTTLAMR